MTKRELRDLNRAAAGLAGAIRCGDAAEVDRWQFALNAFERVRPCRRHPAARR
jgi:hypothetical protein